MSRVPRIRFKGFEEDWEQRKLGEIAERIIRKNEKLESTLPLTISAQYGLIDQNEFFDKRIASKDVRGYYLIKKGEFAYNKSTSVDAPFGAIKRLDKYKNGVLSTLYILFKIIDDTSTSSDYLVTYYFTDLWHNGIQSIAAEGARNHGLLNIAPNDFFETMLSIPLNISEPKKVGGFFISLDHLITLHQRKLEKLKIIKKSMLENLFPQNGEKTPKIRFSGFTKDWEQRKFDEVFDCTIPNNTLSRAELNYDSGSVRNVHYGDILIKYGSVVDVQNDEIPFATGKCSDDFKDALLQNGDIIIADTAEDETTGKACEIGNLQGVDVVSGLHTMVCRPRKKMALGYLGYYLNSDAYHHQLLPLMQGIKVLSLSKTNVQKTIVYYPKNKGEQELIAGGFHNLDNLITLHQSKLEKLQKIKKSMLESMFV